MKFATKLTTVFSALILILGVAVAYFVYATDSNLLENLVKGSLQNQASHTMDKLDMMFFERYADIKTIVNDPVIKARDSNPEKISERLKTYQDNYKYVSLSFFDLNRVRLADTSGKDIGKQHSLTTYWNGIAEGRDFVMDISLSESTKVLIFHFAATVKDKHGTPFGVVVSRIPLERLYSLVKNNAAGYINKQPLSVDLLDSNGLILYSNYNESGIQKEISPDWEDIKEASKTGTKVGSGRHLHPKIGDEVHAFAVEQGYLDFKGNGWTLVIHTPANMVFAPAAEIRNKILLFVLLAELFVILVIRFFSRKLTRPIEQLIIISDEIGKGNLDIDIKAVSNDELGALSVAFSRMAKSLKQAQQDLWDYASGLESKVLERTVEMTNINKQLQSEVNERKETEEALLKTKSILELHNIEMTDINTQLQSEVDERRETEEALLETKAKLELHNYEMLELGEMTELLQTCTSFEDAYNIITQAAIQLFPNNPGALLTFNDSLNLFDAASTWGEHPPSEQVIAVDDCWAMKCGRPHIFKDAEADPQCRLTRDAAGIHLCVPVLEEKDKSIGVIHILVEPEEMLGVDEHLALEEKERLLLNMAGRIGVSLTNLKLKERLRNLSVRDQLTGLFNRRYMEESLGRELSRAERKGLKLGIVMLDIDHFKKFNDTRGHAAGDTLLRALGEFLQKRVRGSDIACRYGGEEFILIMPEATLEIAQRRAEQLRVEVKGMQITHEDKPLGCVTLSLGVAIFPEHGSTIDAVLKAADDALYNAKGAGRDVVCIAGKPCLKTDERI